MAPTSNEGIEILIKLLEINFRKMRNFKTFYRSRFLISMVTRTKCISDKK